MILNKPTNFSNIKYSYPNLNQNRYPNQIIDLTQTYDMDIFFQNNLLLLQSLNKIPIQINLSLLQSLKKKKTKNKTPFLPLQRHPNSNFSHNNNLHDQKKSISTDQQHHHETQNAMEKIKESSFVILKVIHNNQKKPI